jgi:hypothetical protein
MVAQVDFTRGRFDSQRRVGQEIMGAVHAALGGGLLVLLYGATPCFAAPCFVTSSWRPAPRTAMPLVPLRPPAGDSHFSCIGAMGSASNTSSSISDSTESSWSASIESALSSSSSSSGHSSPGASRLQPTPYIERKLHSAQAALATQHRLTRKIHLQPRLAFSVTRTFQPDGQRFLRYLPTDRPNAAVRRA